jgi:hypothetical protein
MRHPHDGEGSASTRRFGISAVPPGTSWFAFHDAGKPETLLSIWFLDNGMRSWCRSSVGTLEEDKEGQGRLQGHQDAAHVWLHQGDIDNLELGDPRA